jgi:hypothetical protein
MSGVWVIGVATVGVGIATGGSKMRGDVDESVVFPLRWERWDRGFLSEVTKEELKVKKKDTVAIVRQPSSWQVT